MSKPCSLRRVLADVAPVIALGVRVAAAAAFADATSFAAAEEAGAQPLGQPVHVGDQVVGLAAEATAKTSYSATIAACRSCRSRP